jgi:hypothetical protein
MVFPDEWEVTKVLAELGPGLGGELNYDVGFADGHTAAVSQSTTIPSTKTD